MQFKERVDISLEGIRRNIKLQDACESDNKDKAEMGLFVYLCPDLEEGQQLVWCSDSPQKYLPSKP